MTPAGGAPRPPASMIFSEPFAFTTTVPTTLSCSVCASLSQSSQAPSTMLPKGTIPAAQPTRPRTNIMPVPTALPSVLITRSPTIALPGFCPFGGDLCDRLMQVRVKAASFRFNNFDAVSSKRSA